MSAYLHCLSHTPLVGHVDPTPQVLAEVDAMTAEARERIARFAPQLIVLFGPDHYNGFFYDVMPAFCIGMAADAIGDFDTAAGPLDVPKALAEACAQSVLDAGVDIAVSYRMQVDHAFAQPLELLLGGLQGCPVIPVFINCVAVPLPGFKRARLLGEAIGQWAKSLDKRVLFLASGGLSHQPPVPELAKVDARMADRLMGSGRQLPVDERQARQNRVIQAARDFVQDPHSLHPLNPTWDQEFLDTLEQGRVSDLDALGNDQLSALAGKSTHEVKTWVAAFAALSAFGPYRTEGRYYRPIPEWIAGFAALGAQPLNNNY
ncbi:3-carboxyethylcatechol 2,3-dioxygenase [Pseudomonas umsongensis]|jgi:2,3-dihydroxyphenylpropionate 1,2-dioxygenase|uniref:2,3-dihydroxyphenylpropionate/2,3-dihydroxicinnamic acid 1,2-dioxygenase n=1 Tax=Pseudomonas umsongensis TaxID=198618 RepID=A0ABX4E1Z9_9PSED|nr:MULTISPECIES: 3-carboxyethylcatechol 2,3-dioxygenase [Pseudomonas]KEX91749.1 3-(2,3-dihydroxyphenyl)propionate dioxygenase [Pseudomonas putida]EPA98054.1 3-(2,3-dihydroxyphenyl)propionate dioxygenase [Pseudomonas sp. G5(2012)]OXR35665.1 3-(2,3-dihydroxyphenyl)propionate dioxygenase [Pseudomonas umsongensis]QFG30881.1 3-carboxyethylcatechol 2,3-dioxygenase [Pseudomonas umsongensis]SDT41579.1 2,3-dihydroxyphenylpropionate 1,2-dioxygenase [Pseudomonas umsongensis]